jgi:very-short-patch-repair endonuclease
LRRESTDAEAKFWFAVRNRQLCEAKFRRQWPIEEFIADFYCVELKLVVEIDGGQHADNIRDDARTTELGKLGYRVLRFWNNDVIENIEGVLDRLSHEIQKTPHLDPLP